MQIAAAQITLYAQSAQSLKDKRRILRSIIDQVRHRFNASIAEVDAMDLHQRIEIGIACVSNSLGHAQNELDTVIHYIENLAESDGVEILKVVFE